MSSESEPRGRQVFLKLKDVSDILDVGKHVLRYWEKEFPQIEPIRIGQRRNLYTQGHVDLFKEIKRLLYDERYTVAGARQRLSEPTPEDPGLIYEDGGNQGAFSDGAEPSGDLAQPPSDDGGLACGPDVQGGERLPRDGFPQATRPGGQPEEVFLSGPCPGGVGQDGPPPGLEAQAPFSNVGLVAGLEPDSIKFIERLSQSPNVPQPAKEPGGADGKDGLEGLIRELRAIREILARPVDRW
ncbi:MAG: MerR family transcriptional regulator [Deltaproteobacteria bacterium]|jgi:DNA-binding transcriptional MerR regulator|nr:MerR family transcriptional regulator [Deltaproteobacteria bacterium]